MPFEGAWLVSGWHGEEEGRERVPMHPWQSPPQQISTHSPIPSVHTAGGFVPAGPALGRHGAAAADSALGLPPGTDSAQPVPGEPDLK